MDRWTGRHAVRGYIEIGSQCPLLLLLGNVVGKIKWFFNHSEREREREGEIVSEKEHMGATCRVVKCRARLENIASNVHSIPCWSTGILLLSALLFLLLSAKAKQSTCSVVANKKSIALIE